jgi:hypothetical protein
MGRKESNDRKVFEGRINPGKIQEGFVRVPEERFIEGDRGKQLEFPGFPKDSRLKKLGRFALSATPKLIFSAGFVAGALYFTKETLEYAADYDEIKIPSENQGLEGLEDYYGLDNDREISDLDRLVLIDQYALAKMAFTSYGDYELLTDYSEGTKRFLKEGRRSILIDGVNLINKIEEHDNIELDEEKDIVRLNVGEGFEFILGDTYDEFLLSGIIDQTLVIDDKRKPPKERDKAISNLQDLFWLSKTDLPIEFYEGSFAFPDTQILLNTSRLYQTLSRLGYSISPEIKFVPYSAETESAGHFEHDGTLILESGSGRGAIVHEEGHQQAFKNTKFGQEEFNKIFNDAVNRYAVDPKNTNIYISDYALTNLKENYAETFETYFLDGDIFRTRLKELRAADIRSYYVLQTMYDFFKDFFHGEQYSKNGKIFDPQPGDFFLISDPNPGRNIELTEEPLSGDLVGSTKNLDTVKIIEGPVDFPYSSGVMRKWKIQVNSIYQENGARVKDYSPLEGWIWELWLGEELNDTEVIEE